MKRALGFALALLGLCVSSQAQPRSTFVNYRIFPSTMTQSEPVITVHPATPLTMFASARTIRTAGGFQSEGIYITTNGGATWTGVDTCNGELTINHGGDPGIAIRPDGRLILTHIGDPTLFPGMYSHFSTDGGANWSSAFAIFAQTNQPPDDKGQTTAMDDDPASPYYGRVYAAWAINGSPFTVLSSYSTDGAQVWTIPATTVNPSPPAHCSGAFVAVGRNGKVFVCWSGLSTSFPFGEDFMGLAFSSNGGANWRTTQNAFDMNGIRGQLHAKSDIYVNGLPQLAVDRSGGARDGWLYVATGEQNLAPAGTDPDIILRRSTNDGLTWSGGIRVNQDPLNNGKIQYFPSVDVDYQGGLNIIFCDDRNTSSDSSEIVLARSTNGGNTWTEWVISDHRFKPKPILGGGYQGDHLALTSVGNLLYPFWMDGSAGLYQIWSTTIDITTLDVASKESLVPDAMALRQNYPNPFNPTTTIDYDLSRGGLVTLKVLDLNGREITLLVNERQGPGTHRIEFNAESLHLASGIYFYQLLTDGRMITKPMVLLK